MELLVYLLPNILKIFTKEPSINDVSFEGEGRSSKNEICRQFLGLRLRRQGEGGGSRNPKLEETSFMDVPLLKVAKSDFEPRIGEQLANERKSTPWLSHEP